MSEQVTPPQDGKPETSEPPQTGQQQQRGKAYQQSGYDQAHIDQMRAQAHQQ